MERAALLSTSDLGTMFLLKLLPLMAAVSHLLACCWWLVGLAGQGGPPSAGRPWFSSYAGLQLPRGRIVAGGPGRQYLLSLHWITTSISTAGLVGDMLPGTLMEILFLLAICIGFLTVYSYVLGNFSAAVLEQNAQSVELRRRFRRRALPPGAAARTCTWVGVAGCGLWVCAPPLA